MVEKQLDLFNIKVSLAVVLQRAARNGRLFYTIRQVSKMLAISGFRVYYLVYNYRLDALLIGGEYRVPYTAILDYLSDRCMITRQYFDYLAWTEAREVKGVLPYISGESKAPPRLRCLVTGLECWIGEPRLSLGCRAYATEPLPYYCHPWQ